MRDIMDALDLTAEQQPQLEDQLVSFTTISTLSNGSNSCDPVCVVTKKSQRRLKVLIGRARMAF